METALYKSQDRNVHEKYRDIQTPQTPKRSQNAVERIQSFRLECGTDRIANKRCSSPTSCRRPLQENAGAEGSITFHSRWYFATCLEIHAGTSASDGNLMMYQCRQFACHNYKHISGRRGKERKTCLVSESLRVWLSSLGPDASGTVALSSSLLVSPCLSKFFFLLLFVVKKFSSLFHFLLLSLGASLAVSLSRRCLVS